MNFDRTITTPEETTAPFWGDKNIQARKQLDPFWEDKIKQAEALQKAEVAPPAPAAAPTTPTAPREQASIPEVITGIGEAVSRTPLQIAGSVARAARGGDPTAIADKESFLTKIIDRADKDAQEYEQRFSGKAEKTIVPFSKIGLPDDYDITTKTLARFPQQSGFSLVSQAAGLAAGIPAGIAGAAAGSPAAGVVAGRSAGMAASGGAAYLMQKDMSTQQLYDTLNATSMKNTGKTLSPEEWRTAYAKNEGHLVEQGISEAIPEAIGNLFGFELFMGAAKKTFGKQLAKSVVGKALDKYGAATAGKILALQAEEQLTETWTQQWQNNIDVEMGLKPGETKRSWTSFDDLRKSNQEVFADIFLLTLLTGAAGKTGEYVKDRMDTTKSAKLVKEVVAENRFDAIPNEFLPAVYKHTEGLSKERPKDKALAEALDAFSKEMDKRGIDYDMTNKFQEYFKLLADIQSDDATGEEVARWASLRDEFKEKNISPDLYQQYLKYQADINKAVTLQRRGEAGKANPAERKEFEGLVNSIAKRATVFGFEPDAPKTIGGVEKGGVVKKPKSAAKDTLLSDIDEAERGKVTSKGLLTGELDIKTEEDLESPEAQAGLDKIVGGVRATGNKKTVEAEETPAGGTLDITEEVKEQDKIAEVKGIASGTLSKNFTFQDDQTPSDMHDLWVGLMAEGDTVDEKNKPAITTLLAERDGLKSDRSAEAVARKKQITAEIEALYGESETVRSNAEAAFLTAQENLAQRVVDKLGEEGVEVEQGRVLEVIDELSDAARNEKGYAKPMFQQAVDYIKMEQADAPTEEAEEVEKGEIGSAVDKFAQNIKQALLSGKVTPEEAIRIHKKAYPDIETWPEMKGKATEEAEKVIGGARAPLAVTGIVDGARVTAETPEEKADIIEQAANEGAASPKNDLAEPTKGQEDANNYKMGHVNLDGLDITIQKAAGSVRRGVDKKGKEWESPVVHHYGYIKKTEGADGEQIDTFLGPNPDSDKVFVVDQQDSETKEFDEHKTMVGFDTAEEARAGYLANYDDTGPSRIMGITEMSMGEFKEWLKSDTTKRVSKEAEAETGKAAVAEMAKDEFLKIDRFLPSAVKESGTVSGNTYQSPPIPDALVEEFLAKAEQNGYVRGMAQHKTPRFPGHTSVTVQKAAAEVLPEQTESPLETETRDLTIEKIKPYLKPYNDENSLLLSIEKFANEAMGEILVETLGTAGTREKGGLSPEEKVFERSFNAKEFAKKVMAFIKENNMIPAEEAEGEKAPVVGGERASEDEPFVPKDGWRSHLMKAREYAIALGVEGYNKKTLPELVADIERKILEQSLPEVVAQGEEVEEAPVTGEASEAEEAELGPVVGSFVDKWLADYRIAADNKAEGIAKLNQQMPTVLKMSKMREYNNAALNSADGLDGLPQWLQDQFAEYRKAPTEATAPAETPAVTTMEERADIEKEILGASDADLDALFDLPEEATKTKPATETGATTETPKSPLLGGRGAVIPKPKPTKSLDDILANVAKEGVTGAEEALKGLYELFGGASLKSFPGGIDEDTYAKAKPHFEAALKHFIEVGKGLKEFATAIIQEMGDAIRPYLKRFVKEYRDQKLAETATTEEAPTEETTAGPKAEEGAAEETGDITLGEETEEEETEIVGGVRVPRGKKLKNAGEQMEGSRSIKDHTERTASIQIALDQMAVGEPKAIVKAILRLTTKADIFKIEAGVEGRTPGLVRWLTGFRASLRGFLNYGGYEAGGRMGRRRMGFEDALIEKVETPEGQAKVRGWAANYISLLQGLQDATKDSLTIDQAVQNICSTMLLPEMASTFMDTTQTLSARMACLNSFGQDLVGKWENQKLTHVSKMSNQLGWYATRAMQDENEPTKDLPILRRSVRLSDITTNEKWRNGENKTGDDLISEFGLRGIEYGQWTNAVHRQLSTNLTYDSFCDLLEIIGAPKKGLATLTGGRTLGLAFGARGRGGRAAAHYEPGNHVINLTRDHGDGSLGHELQHSKHFGDNLFHQSVNVYEDLIDTLKTEYRLENLEAKVEDILRGLNYEIRRWSPTGNRLEDARKFLKQSLDNDFRQRTKFFKDAIGLDGSLEGKYWSKGTELLSRAFEGFLADELQGANEYLVDVNFVAPGAVEAQFNRIHAAYPSEAERERFNLIFKRFYEGMEWSEDGSVKMKDDFVLVSKQQKADAQAAVDKILAKLEEWYNAIYKGKQSEDGLYWYAYKTTERGTAMQPMGFAGYDDSFRLPVEDGKENVEGGRGAIGYTEQLHPDDVVKYQLEPIEHEKNDLTIYQKEDENGISGGQDTEAMEGESAQDVSGPRAPGGSQGGGGVGEREGEGGDGLVDEEGNPVVAGGGDSTGESIPPHGEGTGQIDAGSDAFSPDRIDFVIHSTDLTTNRTKVTTFNGNIAAIRTLKKIEAENRLATAEEQKVLFQFQGWGNLHEVFEYDPPDAWQDRAIMLKQLLDNDEMREARNNLLTGYYTPFGIYDALYRGLSKIGYTGGRFLDPAFGTGHTVGLMPFNMRRNSIITAVEKDSISARIAQQLYQNARVIHNSLEETSIPEGYYDLSMTNVPFSTGIPFDKKYNSDNFQLHDYFINRQLAVLRPGGLLAVITTTSTMDAYRSIAREAFGRQADLVTAIRLPNNTFKDQGTNIATDILLFRKRFEKETSNGVDFKNISDFSVPAIDENGAQKGYTWDVGVNDYFLAHPENIMGKMDIKAQGRWGDPELVIEGEIDSVPDKIDEVFQKLPDGIYQKEKELNQSDIGDRLPAADYAKDGGLFVKDGKIYRNNNGLSEKWIPTIIKSGKNKEIPGKMSLEKYTERVHNMMRHYIGLRGIMRDLLKAQYKNSPEMETLRTQLNDSYKAFVKKYGRLGNKFNEKHILEDLDGGQVLSLEVYEYPDIEGGEETPDQDKSVGVFKRLADIFTKNTAKITTPPTSAKDASEALVHSLMWKGSVNLSYMESLLRIPRADIIEQLKGQIYDDPKIGWVTSDEYLSGRVRDKLKEAEAAAEVNPLYEENVRQLKAIIPVDLEPHQIPAHLGAPWISGETITEFAKELMNSDFIRVQYVPEASVWTIEVTGRRKNDITYHKDSINRSVEATSRWGTRRIGFLAGDSGKGKGLLDYALNGGLPKVYGGGRYTVHNVLTGRDEHLFNPEETDAAYAKLEDIRDKFATWLWESNRRAEKNIRAYNDTHNQLVDRKFNGDHLLLPGKVPDDVIKLLKHQTDAIWRYLTTGRAYFGHEVGAGKTFCMIASIMESKRLGLANKAVFAVKGANIDQIRSDFYRLYPGANVLTVNMLGKTRVEDMRKIATGTWDAIIMSHEALQRIPVSPETELAFLNREADELRQAILIKNRSGDKSQRAVEREIQKKLGVLNTRIRKLMDTPREEGVSTFEEMGTDMLVIDEAQAFKNLDFQTNYAGVKGLKSQRSKRATDIYMKTQYLVEKYGRGLIFASGTPISNSIGELYALQRHFQSEELRKENIHEFDQWVNTFGLIGHQSEPAPEGGGYVQVLRFLKFRGIPELTAKVRRFMDIVTADEIGIPRPRIANPDGKPELIEIEPSKWFLRHLRSLKRRADIVRSSPGGKVVDRPPHLPKSHKHTWNPDSMVCSTCGARWDGVSYKGVPDNIVRILANGRMAALDPRLLDPTQPDNPNTKTNTVVSKIFDLYRKGFDAEDPDTGETYTENNAVQLVFSDLGVPHGDGSFSVYEDIKQKLIKLGVPEQEIAFIQDATNAKGNAHKKEMAKRKLYERTRAGKIRILLGGTSNLGTGTNVQDRVVVVHNLDADWNAANQTQRIGRAIRRGNRLKAVFVYNYGIKKGVDSFMWSTVGQKQYVISQILSKNPLIRDSEDIGSEDMSAREFSARLADDPLVQERFTLEGEVRKLRAQRGVYDQTKREQLAELQALPQHIEGYKARLAPFVKSDEILKQVTSIKIGMDFYDLSKDGGKVNDLALTLYPEADMKKYYAAEKEMNDKRDALRHALYLKYKKPSDDAYDEMIRAQDDLTRKFKAENPLPESRPFGQLGRIVEETMMIKAEKSDLPADFRTETAAQENAFTLLPPTSKDPAKPGVFKEAEKTQIKTWAKKHKHTLIALENGGYTVTSAEQGKIKVPVPGEIPEEETTIKKFVPVDASVKIIPPTQLLVDGMTEGQKNTTEARFVLRTGIAGNGVTSEAGHHVMQSGFNRALTAFKTAHTAKIEEYNFLITTGEEKITKLEDAVKGEFPKTKELRDKTLRLQTVTEELLENQRRAEEYRRNHPEEFSEDEEIEAGIIVESPDVLSAAIEIAAPELPPLPERFRAYRNKDNSGVTIYPEAGSSFSEEEEQQIMDWAEAQGYDVDEEGSSFIIIDDSGGEIELPKPGKKASPSISVDDGNMPTLADWKEFFKNEEVVQMSGPNSQIYIKTRSGKYLTVNSVHYIDPNTVELKISHDIEKFDPDTMDIVGAYGDGVIRLVRNKAGKWTAAHEYAHFLEDAGIINEEDATILQNYLKRQIGFGMRNTANSKNVGGKEDRANFIADAWTSDKPIGGLVGVVLNRIQKFFDKLMGVLGIRTAGMITREVKSGEIFERELESPEFGGETAESLTAPSVRKKTQPDASRTEISKKTGGWQPGMDAKTLANSLKLALNKNKVISILTKAENIKSGPLDGGCRVLARALNILEPAGKVITIESQLRDGSWQAEHYGLKVGSSVVDGNGLSLSPEGWAKQIAKDENLIRPYRVTEGEVESKEIPKDDKVEAKLSDALKKEFANENMPMVWKVVITIPGEDHVFHRATTLSEAGAVRSARIELSKKMGYNSISATMKYKHTIEKVPANQKKEKTAAGAATKAEIENWNSMIEEPEYKLPADIEIVTSSAREKELFGLYGMARGGLGDSGRIWADDETGKPMAYTPSRKAMKADGLTFVQTEPTPEEKKATQEFKDKYVGYKKYGGLTKEAYDAVYLKAVEAGDMETAQRMVDEAAKRWAKDTAVIDETTDSKAAIVYHGTEKSFNKFEIGDVGYHFGATEEQARNRGNKILKAYLNIKNPLIMEDVGLWDDSVKVLEAMRNWGIKRLPNGLTAKKMIRAIDEYEVPEEQGLYTIRTQLKVLGYDGIQYDNETEGPGFSYIAFEQNQIKSAEPVTYDDNGKVIPLSERFKEESPDIRYAVEDVTETPKFKKWFGDSKVVDKNGKPLEVAHMTATDFDAFKAGGNTPEESGRGIWFGKKGVQAAVHHLGREPKYREGARSVPVYLKIESPIVFDEANMDMRKYRKDNKTNPSFPMKLNDSDIDLLMGQGHDGIIYKHKDPSGNDQTEYVVFEPTQIKSIYNTGAFDPKNPDIRYAAVFHGTPHIWQPEPGFPHGRPRLDMVGAGEGAATYGWGWYSAEAEETGNAYRKTLAGPKDSSSIGYEIGDKYRITLKIDDKEYWLASDYEHPDINADFDDEWHWVDNVEDSYDFGEGYTRFGKDALDPLEKMTDKIGKLDIDAYPQEFRGGLYKLDIPDDVMPKLLDWDKPLSEQSEYVRKALETIKTEEYPELFEMLQQAKKENWVGGKLYDAFAAGTMDEGDMGAYLQDRNEEDTSNFFAELGIPGNKYLDQMSRDKPQWTVKYPSGKVFSQSSEKHIAEKDAKLIDGGYVEQTGGRTYNYVIWDQKVLDSIALLERNGEKLDAIRKAEEAKYSLAPTEGEGETALDIEMVQGLFQNQNIKQDGDNYEITLKNGEKAIVYGVTEITPNAVALKVGYKGSMAGKTVAGSYEVDEQGRHIIRVVRDNENAPWLLAHESAHMLIKMGIISKADQATISAVARKEGKWDDNKDAEENQVNWLADFATRPQPKQSVLAQIWQKIQDFVNRIAGIRTAEMIGRGFASGKMFDKKVSAKDASALFNKTDERYAVVADHVNGSSLFPDVDERLDASRGVKRETLKERAEQSLVTGWEHFTRKYPHLDPKTDGALIDIFRVYQDAPVWAKEETVRRLSEFAGKLTPEGRKVFAMNIILPDMIRDVESGTLSVNDEKGLPFGYKDMKQVQQDYNHYKELAKTNPEITKALETRNAYMAKLTEQLIEHKLLKKAAAKDPSAYFHHQVLYYMNYKQNPNFGMSSKDVRTHVKGWQIGRSGSLLDYNTEYIESEFEVISQALVQIEAVKTLKKIEKLANIKPDLVGQAKDRNLATFYRNAKKQGLITNPLDDPLLPYRTKIAIGFRKLAKLVTKGEIYVPEEFEEIVEFIGEQEEQRKAAEEDEMPFAVESHPRMFSLLNYLVNHEGPGAMPAAMIFKAIANRNAFMKKVIGNDWVTYKSLVPDGFVLHKPEAKGTFFYTNGIADQALEQVLAGRKNLPEAVRQVLVRGKDEEWVIKEGIAKTMDAFRPAVIDSLPAQISKGILTTWKQWILMNPFRVIKYNLNNLSGDLDIAMAYDPKIITGYFWQATKDLWALSRGTAPEALVNEMSEFTKNGVIGSGMTKMDIPELDNVKSVKSLVDFFDGKSKNALSRWYTYSKKLSTLRENILRVAAYRYFLDRLNRGEYVNPGASRKEEVDQVLRDLGVEATAAKLARELIGDYGNVSHAGQYIRERMIPFYSWLEINAPRYVRLFKNLKHEAGGGGYASAGGVLAWKATKLGLKATALMGLIMLYNAAVWPDEEEELQETGREQLHLILGRRADGSIITLRFQGALSDALSWFGMSNPVEDIKSLARGTKGAKDLAKEMALATPIRLFQGLRPEPKIAYEVLSGRSFYPDPLHPRPIRDTAEHVFRTFSLDKIYNRAAGKPKQGGTWESQLIKDVIGLVAYEADPGEQAYYTARKYVFDWLDAEGKEKPAAMPTNKSNALYYYKQALKYGDFDAAKKYLKKYQELGGDLGNITGSINRVHPLSSLKRSDRYRFKETLTPEQIKTTETAIEWYKRHYVDNYTQERSGRVAEKAAAGR